MPFAKLELKPGINTQVSRYASEMTWRESDKIRWLQGMLQKLGGWMRMTSQAVIGVARGIHAWETLANNPELIIGTNERVQLFDGGQIEDITPLKKDPVNVSPDLSTTEDSQIVTINDTGSNTEAGDWIYLPVYVSIGGVVLYGYYQVVTSLDTDSYTVDAGTPATATVSNSGAVPVFTTVNGSPTVNVKLDNYSFPDGAFFYANVSTSVGGLTISGAYIPTPIDADNFSITADGNATSDDTASENGGDVQFQYLLPTGAADPITESGWGGGDWGGGSWGEDDGSNVAITPVRQWFFDNWGEDGIGNYTNGGLYIWIPPYVTNPRMTQISEAPQAMTASFVAMPQQIMVALGAETGGTQDPNLIRWSDVDDYTDWTATVTNQAGSYRIPTGSHIVGGIQGPLQALIWTDLDVWSMQYIQLPYVFGFTRIGQSCGLLAARAATILGSVVYWLGYKQFYYYAGGGVQALPCTVFDFIFNNLDYTRSDKVFAASNSLFNEVAFFFPSKTGNGEVDSYVKFNVAENLWDYGMMVRTCWTDESVFGPPIGVDGNGLIQQHETSNDADGAPLVAYALTSYTDVSNGSDFWFADLVEPTFNDTTSDSTINLILFSQKNQGSPVVQRGPYDITNTTQYLTTRMRGRFLAARIGSSDLGSFWRFNTLRVRYSQDGKWG